MMEGVQSTAASSRSIQLASILRAQYSSGKVSLPVNGGVYARFRHVQGVPGSAEGGFTLSKLQMIDIMVERLVRLQGEGVDMAVSTDKSPDSVIHALAEQLHEAMTGQGELAERFSAGIVEPGMLLSLYM